MGAREWLHYGGILTELKTAVLSMKHRCLIALRERQSTNNEQSDLELLEDCCHEWRRWSDWFETLSEWESDKYNCEIVDSRQLSELMRAIKAYETLEWSRLLTEGTTLSEARDEIERLDRYEGVYETLETVLRKIHAKDEERAEAESCKFD